jgi:hypothetical protein
VSETDEWRGALPQVRYCAVQYSQCKYCNIPAGAVKKLWPSFSLPFDCVDERFPSLLIGCELFFFNDMFDANTS